MIIFFFISLFASFLASLVGLGGGFLMVPALLHIGHQEFKNAVFLSLCSVLFLSILKLNGHRDIIKRDAKKIFPFVLLSGLGALVASYSLPYVPTDKLEIAFGILLIGVSLHLILSKEKEDAVADASKWITHPLFMLAGILAGLFGVGGGILGVPLLHKALRYPMKEATILSFFFFFFSSAVALIVQFQNRREDINQLNPLVVILLLAGAFVGYKLSRKVKISNRGLKIAFSVLLIGVGIFQIIG